MDTKQAIIDTTTHAELVHCLSEKLRANYVFPDIAEQICARLQEHLADGDYTGITEGEFLAFALTQHMQEVKNPGHRPGLLPRKKPLGAAAPKLPLAIPPRPQAVASWLFPVNGDEHLWVRWYPEPLPEHSGQLRHNEEWLAERRLEARLDNYGLHKVERLPGNIGYLEIRFFPRPAWGGDTAVAAMNFVANANALIIDLRGCVGGYPGMVALILSYLFGEEPVHLNSIYWRDDEFTQQHWTLPHGPGRRFGDKPVYVLTSRDTFSGGEEFAYDLQTRQRATLVGEKTDGGAHSCASYRLHPYFEVFIPVGRAINPVTSTNWERTGVLPDVTVPAEQALKAACQLALKSVIAKIGEPASGPLGALLKEAQQAIEIVEH